MNFLRDRKYTLVYCSQKCMAASSPATNQGTIFQEGPVINSLPPVSKPKFQVNTLELIWVRTPFFYPGALLWAWSHWEYWGPGDLVIAMEQGFIPTEVGKVSRPTSTNRSDLNREHSTVPVLPPQPELRNVPKDMHTYVRKWESVRPQTCDGQHKVDFFPFFFFFVCVGVLQGKGNRHERTGSWAWLRCMMWNSPPKKVNKNIMFLKRNRI